MTDAKGSGERREDRILENPWKEKQPVQSWKLEVGRDVDSPEDLHMR